MTWRFFEDCRVATVACTCFDDFCVINVTVIFFIISVSIIWYQFVMLISVSVMSNSWCYLCDDVADFFMISVSGMWIESVICENALLTIE